MQGRPYLIVITSNKLTLSLSQFSAVDRILVLVVEVLDRLIR